MVTPSTNPKFDPKKYQLELEGQNRVGRDKPKAPKKGIAPKADGLDPKPQSWKARNSSFTIKDGIVTLKGTAPDPFLEVGVSQHKGAAKISFPIHAPEGGEGKVNWANGQP
ncbi:MAG: hypothetical protein QNL80_03890 [Akkermansiaceae bacterium]